MKEFIIALTLFGIISTSIGRIGIRVSADGRVEHTHTVSPSAGLIYEGDIVVEADGKKGLSGIEGTPGTTCRITIKRGKEIKVFNIIRVPKDEIHDLQN